jgi:hypothetical protein
LKVLYVLDRSFAVLQFRIDKENVDVLKVLYVLDSLVAVLQFCIDIEDVDVLKVLHVLDTSVAVLQFHIDIEDVNVLKVLQLGLGTGNPRVQNSHTAPIPANTAPLEGKGIYPYKNI